MITAASPLHAYPVPATIVVPDLTLGLDMGGTKVSALVVDDDDQALARFIVTTDVDDPIASLVAAAHGALDQVPGGRHRLRAAGISSPGHVDAARGVVRMAVNLRSGELPVARLVGEALGVPCFLDHDARATAMWLTRPPHGEGSLGYLSVGTGVSAGIVIDGQPLRGDRGLAGEVGHFIAVPDGPLCGCGLNGCLEAVASGPSVAREAQDAVGRGEPSSLSATGLTGEAVYAAAAAGDPLAVSITTTAGEHLARAVRAMALGYGLSRIVVGGGPTRAGTAFSGPLKQALMDERDASSLVRDSVPEIELLPADSDATAWGAVTVARVGLTVQRERRKEGGHTAVLP